MVVTVMFLPAVALVCAAAGPQALGSLCPPGLTEEEASACRALHHQRYSHNNNTVTFCSLKSQSVSEFMLTHSISLLLL